jgi:hypothetical protein
LNKLIETTPIKENTDLLASTAQKLFLVNGKDIFAKNAMSKSAMLARGF